MKKLPAALTSPATGRHYKLHKVDLRRNSQASTSFSSSSPPLSPPLAATEDVKKVLTIHGDEMILNRPGVCAVYPSTFRLKEGFRTEEHCVVVIVLAKGFCYEDGEPLPPYLDGGGHKVGVDVRQGCFELWAGGDDQATRPLDTLLMGCQIASADLKTYGTLGFFATKTIPSSKRGKGAAGQILEDNDKIPGFVTCHHISRSIDGKLCDVVHPNSHSGVLISERSSLPFDAHSPPGKLPTRMSSSNSKPSMRFFPPSFRVD